MTPDIFQARVDAIRALHAAWRAHRRVKWSADATDAEKAATRRDVLRWSMVVRHANKAVARVYEYQPDAIAS